MLPISEMTWRFGEFLVGAMLSPFANDALFGAVGWLASKSAEMASAIAPLLYQSTHGCSLTKCLLCSLTFLSSLDYLPPRFVQLIPAMPRDFACCCFPQSLFAAVVSELYRIANVGPSAHMGLGRDALLSKTLLSSGPSASILQQFPAPTSIIPYNFH